MKKEIKKRVLIIMLMMGFGCLLPAVMYAAGLPRKTLIDSSWKFFLGDEQAASKSDYNDSKWRIVNLPHDWSIEHSIDEKALSGNDGGYRVAGIAWYRKELMVPAALKEEKVYLYFEGVYMNSSIYVNGQLIGGHPYGYTSFFCDATSAIIPGKKNVVAVRVDNSQQKNCRWYSGSGIYRHIWLIHTPKVHIENWGVAVHTPQVSASQATVQVKTMLNNETSVDKEVKVTVKVADAEDAVSTVIIPARGKKEVIQKLKVSHPKLWDINAPNLYDAHISILDNDKIIDTYSQSFGIRTIHYSVKGFFLNGRKLDLNGGCVHHDNGILGAAAFDRAEFRKVQMMKSAGFNALRTSHNLPSEAFLEACDRLGMLVIDEAFDGWREAKTPHDYASLFDKYWQQDIEGMVLRDLNHPSIIAWSIGNEVIERKKIEVVTTAHKLASKIREYDNRPITSALAAWDSAWEIYDPLAAELDITGYNYMIHKHAEDHQRVPDRVMWQTESYAKDTYQNWSLVHDFDYIIGDFIWTGIDYLGESGIGRWWYDGDVPGEHYERPLYPWHAAYCGDIDLTGWRKPISHYRNLLYNDTEKLYMAVREPDGYYGKIRTGLWTAYPTWESWNWPGHEGKNIEVEVYSKYPIVRLYLDDKLVGEKVVGRETEMKAVFSLPFKPGTLKVEGVENGVVKDAKMLSSASEPVAIRTKVENREMKADGTDLSFVQIEIVDREGRVCPNASVELEAIVTGSGVLAALGNADIKDPDTYADQIHKSWKGRALAVVRSTKKAGKVKLTIKSKGLKTSAEIIQSR